jgi:hypothetical protein
MRMQQKLWRLKESKTTRGVDDWLDTLDVNDPEVIKRAMKVLNKDKKIGRRGGHKAYMERQLKYQIGEAEYKIPGFNMRPTESGTPALVPSKGGKSDLPPLTGLYMAALRAEQGIEPSPELKKSPLYKHLPEVWMKAKKGDKSIPLLLRDESKADRIAAVKRMYDAATFKQGLTTPLYYEYDPRDPKARQAYFDRFKPGAEGNPMKDLFKKQARFNKFVDRDWGEALKDNRSFEVGKGPKEMAELAKMKSAQDRFRRDTGIPDVSFTSGVASVYSPSGESLSREPILVPLTPEDELRHKTWDQIAKYRKKKFGSLAPQLSTVPVISTPQARSNVLSTGIKSVDTDLLQLSAIHEDATRSKRYSTAKKTRKIIDSMTKDILATHSPMTNPGRAAMWYRQNANIPTSPGEFSNLAKQRESVVAHVSLHNQMLEGKSQNPDAVRRAVLYGGKQAKERHKAVIEGHMLGASTDSGKARQNLYRGGKELTPEEILKLQVRQALKGT